MYESSDHLHNCLLFRSASLSTSSPPSPLASSSPSSLWSWAMFWLSPSSLALAISRWEDPSDWYCWQCLFKQGLLITVTITLTLTAQRMAKKNCLVKNLPDDVDKPVVEREPQRLSSRGATSYLIFSTILLSLSHSCSSCWPCCSGSRRWWSPHCSGPLLFSALSK